MEEDRVVKIARIIGESIKCGNPVCSHVYNTVFMRVLFKNGGYGYGEVVGFDSNKRLFQLCDVEHGTTLEVNLEDFGRFYLDYIPEAIKEKLIEIDAIAEIKDGAVSEANDIAEIETVAYSQMLDAVEDVMGDEVKA